MEIRAEHVVKQYEDNPVPTIPDLDLTIKDGELFTLLGPSGCGKTTLLRIFAGFNTLEGGEFYFDDKPMSSVPPQKRNIGMVFQNYAIFPHLNVRQNVEFGLKQRKIPADEMKSRVDEILRVVKIEEYADRLPDRLSGGQQQRVALARAIVINPSVLLMDEPLSNLDAKLRIEMRTTIRELQKHVGITTVYVTHDQEEALSISDRIAVMKLGEIQQVGAPMDIYLRPYNTFVAGFIGFSNLFYGTVSDAAAKQIKLNDDCVLTVPELSSEVANGQRVIVSMRPNEFSYADKGIEMKVLSSTFLGQNMCYKVSFENVEALELEDENEIDEPMNYLQKRLADFIVFNEIYPAEAYSLLLPLFIYPIAYQGHYPAHHLAVPEGQHRLCLAEFERRILCRIQRCFGVDIKLRHIIGRVTIEVQSEIHKLVHLPLGRNRDNGNAHDCIWLY